MDARASGALAVSISDSLGRADRTASRHQLSDELRAPGLAEPRIAGSPAPAIDHHVTAVLGALEL